MDNEERIRKWREGRAAGGVKRPFAEDQPRKSAGAPDIQSAPRSDERARQPLPDDLDVEEARIAIVERRRANWRRIMRRVAIFVALPLLTVLLYIALIATPLYQGEAVFTVQTSSDAAPSPAAGLFGVGSGGSTISDAFKAREFILSRPMMEHMEERHGFMSHFATWKMDPLTRFQGPLGLNSDPFGYYQQRVRVAVDVQEGLLHLYVQARTRDDAIRFGNGILAAAEEHVSNFSDKISEDQVSALSRDVQNAERQLSDARRSLAAVQSRRGDISPEQTATSIYQLISTLELQRAEAERERDALLSQGLTDNPNLPRLNARIRELNQQIAEQRQRLVSPGGQSLQRSINEFESASSRKEIAQARWESTLSTLQQAYLRILEQRRYFVIVVGMSASAFPKVRDVLTIAWPILLLLALAYLIAMALRRAALGGRPADSNFAEVIRRWRRQ